MKTSLGLALALFASACAGSVEDDPELGAELASEQLDSVTQAIAVSGIHRPGSVLPVGSSDGFKYFELDGVVCRSGSKAGVSLKRGQSSDNVLVYLQGGGGCFNTQTCLEQVNPSSIKEGRRAPGAGGIFAPGEANPFHDYNVAYVPYCTGDFHVGNKISSVPAGPSNQKFVGRKNLELILQSVVATFPDAKKVVVVGSSAGGAGATGSVAPVKRAFAASNPALYLINDAGPILASGNNILNDYFPIKKQAQLKELWGLQSTFLADCGSDCNSADFFSAFNKKAAQIIGRKAALVVGKQDTTVALLFANLRVDIYPGVGFFGIELRKALDDYRTRTRDTWSTYYVTLPSALAQKHMFLLDNDMWNVSQQVVGKNVEEPLVDWLEAYLADAPTPAVGP